MEKRYMLIDNYKGRQEIARAAEDYILWPEEFKARLRTIDEILQDKNLTNLNRMVLENGAHDYLRMVLVRDGLGDGSWLDFDGWYDCKGNMIQKQIMPPWRRKLPSYPINVSPDTKI